MKDFFVKLLKHPIVVNLLAAAVVTLAIIWGVLHWLDAYTRHNEAVIVPDVKGMRLEEAETFFRNNRLRYSVIDSVFSKDVAPGSIVELVPGAGSKVKEGRIVFVTINALTSQMAVIPETEDLSFRQAYSLLRGQGFDSIEIKYVPGAFKDLAIGVEVQGRKVVKGEHIPLSVPLTLVVSSGEMEPDSLSIDSLSIDGLPLDELPEEDGISEEESWF